MSLRPDKVNTLTRLLNKKFYLFRFITTIAGDITITDLTRHEGIIAFEELEAKIIMSQHLHLHIVDMDMFKTSFANLKYALKLFEKQNSTERFHLTLDTRMKRLTDNFNRLIPNKRTKRGLLNPLGTFIKSITGNLDDNDLNMIKQTIDNTNAKTNMLIHNNEQQIRINEKFQDKINVLIRTVNNQHIDTMKKLSGIMNNILDKDENTIRGVAHDIILNMQLLEDQFNDIFESIQLARIGIISKAILSNDETKFSMDMLEDQNIQITHPDQVYEFLNVQVYHEGFRIIFVVKIPIFLPGKFKYIKFETIPDKFKIISTKFNIAIMDEQLTFATTKHCLTIENYRLCKQQEITNITGDGCIHNALRGNDAACPYEEQRNTASIKSIDGHTLIIKNAIQPILLNSTCNIRNRKVTGTLLIKYPNCSIIINGVKYDDEKTSDNHEMLLIPTIGVDFTASKIFEKPDLQQINLLRIENRNHISKLQRDQQTLQYTTTGVLSLLAVVAIGLVIWNWKNHRNMSSKVNPENKIDCVPLSLSTEAKHDLSEIRDESFPRGEQLTPKRPSDPSESSPSTSLEHQPANGHKFRFHFCPVSERFPVSSQQT